MEVLFNKDISRPGNDCYLHESISIIREFGKLHYRYRLYATGWASTDEAYETTNEMEFSEYIKRRVSEEQWSEFVLELDKARTRYAY